jgi:hypothetical protein
MREEKKIREGKDDFDGKERLFQRRYGQVISCFIIMGNLPLYWKQLDRIPSIRSYANRVFLSFLFVFVFLILQKRVREYSNMGQRQSPDLLFCSGFIILFKLVYVTTRSIPNILLKQVLAIILIRS